MEIHEAEAIIFIAELNDQMLTARRRLGYAAKAIKRDAPIKSSDFENAYSRISKAKENLENTLIRLKTAGP